jgi:hypothetical protein
MRLKACRREGHAIVGVGEGHNKKGRTTAKEGTQAKRNLHETEASINVSVR